MRRSSKRAIMTHRREGCDEVCVGSGSDAQLFVCLGVLAETRVCSPKGELSSVRVHQEVIPIHKEIVNLIFFKVENVDILCEWRYCKPGPRWRKTMQGTMRETQESWEYIGRYSLTLQRKEVMQLSRKSKKKKKGEKSKASVRKRWGAGTYSKRCCMSLTPTQRGCSGGSGFCHVDVAEADHSGWWSWVSQCQVSFWLGHHSP